jgi:Plastocyanin
MKRTLSASLLTLALVWGSSSWGETPTAGAYQATIAADGVQHVQIDGGSYFFKPNHVIVKVNVPVELSLKSEGGFTPHNFVIQAPEAGIKVEQNITSEAKIIRFVPMAVGKYPYYCSKGLPFFKNHREKGMEGMLEVVN